MLPEDLERAVLEIYDELAAMKVDLSGHPELEPFDYIHEKVEEIHRHSTYLTSLIVKSNRWRAFINLQVERQKQIVDFKFNEMLIKDDDVRRKRTGSERKSAAALHVKEEQEELLELKGKQLEVEQLCKSLARKATELKGKSIDLKIQKEMIELEWNQAGHYRGGQRRSEHAPDVGPPRKYADEGEEEETNDQLPTAEDLGLDLAEATGLQPKIKEPSLGSPKKQGEDPLEGAVEVTEVVGGLTSLTPVPEEGSRKELSAAEGSAVPSPPLSVEERDLDALLAEVDLVNKGRRETQKEGSPEAEQATESQEPESPPGRRVGETTDFDALLDDF